MLYSWCDEGRREDLNILISTFCVCADFYEVFLKLFTVLSNYNIVICCFEKVTTVILKMLTITLLKIPFAVIGRCSSLSAPHCLENVLNSVVIGSVVDPDLSDPSDPHVFGPPGSGSTSQRYGSGSGSGSGSRSFYHHAKIVRKTLIPTILWLFLTFYLWKML